MSQDPRAPFIETALDPAFPTAPCPVCGFPTATPRGEQPATCTRCRAHVVIQGLADLRQEAGVREGGEMGPCARCRRPCHRYGGGGRPLCDDCHPDLATETTDPKE